MSTHNVNMPGGIAAIGDHATLNFYNIGPVGPDRPTLRPTLRNAVDPLMDRHIVLGGRQIELSELTTSIEQRPGCYAFVTGPSGYGKTALLVHLVRSLQQCGDDPVYHFISQRDAMLSEADFCFRSLCQQLIARHGFGGELPSSTADVRVLYPVLLRTPPAPGSRIVVVLDGLDEASQWSAGPEMFPVDLPPRVHVVFSAREIADHDWLGELGIDGRADVVVHLETLDEHGVRDVLAASEAQPLKAAAENSVLVKAVHDVSGGDPFYLHCLAEDLTKCADITETVVRQQPRGLTNYLNRWWRDVAQQAANLPAVENILGYLAVANGPLTRSELADISADDRLSGFTVDPAVEAVKRYLAGAAETGYQLCHPRFADYVANSRLGPGDLNRYRQALLRWCLSWQDQAWPSSTPAYALRHVVTHLIEDAQQTNRVHAVLDAPFLAAKLARFGSFRSILDDLRSGVAAATPASGAAALFRLAATHSAIQDGIADLPVVELAPLYAQAGDLDRALDLASALHPLWRRSKAMVAVSGALLPSRWAEALDVAEGIELPGYRADALTEVAAVLLTDDATAPSAQAILERIDEIDLSHDAPRWAAVRMAKLAAALRPRDPVRADTLVGLAITAANAARGPERVEALEFIAQSVAATDPARACGLYRTSLEVMNAMGLNDWQAQRARDTIKAIAIHDRDAAVAAAEKMSNILARPYVFAGLAEQADGPADAQRWVRRARAAIPEIRFLAKAEKDRWEDGARAAAIVGLARHAPSDALAQLTTVSYSLDHEAALKRMASVTAENPASLREIAQATSDPAVRDEVIAIGARSQVRRHLQLAGDLIQLVSEPITAAELLVEAAEQSLQGTAEHSQEDEAAVLGRAQHAARKVADERPDLLARLAAAADARHHELAGQLLASAVESARKSAGARLSADSPRLTVIRCCLDQGDNHSAVSLLQQISRSVIVIPSYIPGELRVMLVEAAARYDETTATELIRVSPADEAAVLHTAMVRGVASTNPHRGRHLADTLLRSGPRSGAHEAEDLQRLALGTLMEACAVVGAPELQIVATQLRDCGQPYAALDYTCDIHARACAAMAAHDFGLASQLLCWASSESMGRTTLVADALTALASVDRVRAVSVSAKVINDYAEGGRSHHRAENRIQEDLAVLGTAVARFAPEDALAFLGPRRLYQCGYRGQVLGWAAASVAQTDQARAKDLLDSAIDDVRQAEWAWLQVDGLREVAAATARWNSSTARELIEDSVARARAEDAVTTLAQQLAQAAEVLIDIADVASAMPWIEEALALLRPEPRGATRDDALQAMVRIFTKCQPDIAYSLLVQTVEAMLDGGPFSYREWKTILGPFLTISQQNEAKMARELFTAFHTAISAAETVFAA